MSDDREKQAAKTTIVGGPPPENDRELPPIPVGIEEILGMASVNHDFAGVLFEDRPAAIHASHCFASFGDFRW